jgi:hypothetical protein
MSLLLHLFCNKKVVKTVEKEAVWTVFCHVYQINSDLEVLCNISCNSCPRNLKCLGCVIVPSKSLFNAFSPYLPYHCRYHCVGRGS